MAARPLPKAQGAVLSFWSGDDMPTEGSPMDKKWRVGAVELLGGGLLFGFVLYDHVCFVRLCG
jgi:hypothetical protein